METRLSRFKDLKKYPYCSKGHQYALDIVSGKILACRYVIGACQRYLDDISNLNTTFYFDHDEAEKFLRNVQKFEHVIGNWPNKNIVYEPWQCWVWMCIMGFKNKSTKLRRFRVAHVEIGRGNAKSAMASQVVLYFLALDNPNGNQISTVATKKDQARIVLDSSMAMARKNPSFLKHTGVKVLAHTIKHPPSNSIARALSAEHKGLDGLNDILAVCDELHAMTRNVFETITSGMSKRKDSLTLCITTAGQDVHSVGYSQSTYAKKICLQEVNDDQFFAAVYTLDEGDKRKGIPADDWTDENVWIKANPNIDVSVDRLTLKAKVQKALVTPADIPGLKIKHFNMWISEASAFFDQSEWDKCYNPNLKIEDFQNQECRLGLDLASHIDIASIGIVFKDRKTGKYFIFDKSYLPEETVTREKNDLYNDCIAKGFLIQTPGAAINYEFIQGEAEALSKDYRIEECLYDAWNATETAQKLSSKIEMVKIGMTVANFSEPMKKLDGLMRKGMIEHNGSPLLRWCLGNVVAKMDHNGNVFPRKSHLKLKIDPIVAILMALAGWLQTGEEESVYETSGIRTI